MSLGRRDPFVSDSQDRPPKLVLAFHFLDVALGDEENPGHGDAQRLAAPSGALHCIRNAGPVRVRWNRGVFFRPNFLEFRAAERLVKTERGKSSGGRLLLL